MATALENLQTARDNVISELATLTDPTKRKLNYNIDGKTVDWIGYKNHLMQAEKQLREAIAFESGPFEVVSQGYT